jgi:hypothetical protein
MGRLDADLRLPPKQQQSNGTPGKKPPAPSLKLWLGRTPLEQRSGNKPLAPSAQRGSTVRKETDEAEASFVRR